MPTIYQTGTPHQGDPGKHVRFTRSKQVRTYTGDLVIVEAGEALHVSTSTARLVIGDGAAEEVTEVLPEQKGATRGR